MRITVTGIYDIFSASSGRKKPSQMAAIGVKSPYIQSFGLQIDPDANGAAIRNFTAQEEEEFLAISRRPNFYKEFIASVAPQIYGSDGKLVTF